MPLNAGENVFHEQSCEWGNANEWIWEGFKIYWRVLGIRENPPVVFVHGFGASSSHWRNNAKAFENAGYCVYALDLIGFGRSSQPGPKQIRKLDNFFWSKQLIAFLKEVVESDKCGKAVLVGNSLGSLVAITASVFCPKYIAAVVAAPLPDPAFMQRFSYPQTRFFLRLRNLFLTIFFNLLPLELLVPFIVKTGIIKKGLQAAYCKTINTDKELQILVSAPAKRSTAARALRAMCIGMSDRPKIHTAPALLDSLSNRARHLPILLVWGSQDRLVPLFVGQKIVNQYSWLKLFVIEKTGHCLHDESWREFNQLVLDWLKLNLET